jgi:hypothetical protein
MDETANQTVELTASRRYISFLMPSFSSPAATRALACRSSSCSR